MDLSDLEYVDGTFHQTIYPRCNPEVGDVLLTKDGANTGNVTLNTLSVPFSLLSSVCVLKPDKSKLHPKFLMYYLQSEEGFQQVTGQMTGAAIKRIILKTIKASKVPVPPLNEQCRIVAILDEAFAALATATANFEKAIIEVESLYTTALETHFRNLSHAGTTRLADVSTIQYGYTESACQERIGPKFLRITDIQEGAVDWESVPFCRIDAAEHQRQQLRTGDIVFARTGATTGKSYVLSEPPDAVCASYLIRLRPRLDLLSPGFLGLFFQTRSYWANVRRGIIGSAQGGFNASKLASMEVPLVSLNKQDEIIEALRTLSAAVRSGKQVYRRKIGGLTILKQAILRAAFAGKLGPVTPTALRAAE